MVRNQIKQTGLLISIVHGMLPPEATVSDAKSLVAKVSSNDLETVINKHLLPEEKLHTYFFDQELERLRQKYIFEIEHESHSKPIHERIVKLRTQANNLGLQARQHWASGQFQEGVHAWKGNFQVINQLTLLRNPEIIDDLKLISKKLMRENEGGSLVILFGGSHSSLIDILQRKLGPKAPVKFDSIDLMPQNIPDSKIFSILQSNKTPEDLDYAQDFLINCMNELLRLHFLNQRNLHIFANNWQTIYEVAVRVATSLSLGQIEGLIRSQSDFVEFLRRHPLVEPIKQYFS